MKRYLRSIFFLVLIIMSVFFVRAYWLQHQEEQALREHGQLVSGKIIAIQYHKNGRVELTYQLQFNSTNKIYTRPYPGIRTNIDSLKGKSFPVLYLPTDPDNNRILILPYDFERMNRNFPDSLEWLKNYFERKRK